MSTILKSLLRIKRSIVEMAETYNKTTAQIKEAEEIKEEAFDNVNYVQEVLKEENLKLKEENDILKDVVQSYVKITAKPVPEVQTRFSLPTRSQVIRIYYRDEDEINDINRLDN